MTERISGLRSQAKVTRNENVKIVFRVYLPEKQIDLTSDEDQNYSRQILHISPITLRQRKRIIFGVRRNTASDTSDTSDTSESNYILGRGSTPLRLGPAELLN